MLRAIATSLGLMKLGEAPGQGRWWQAQLSYP